MVRRFATRRSAVHGRGVFALVDIPAEEYLVEYRGEVITWEEACARFERAGGNPHTFLFDRGDGYVIDGGSGGSSARWINHSCEPNCESMMDDEQRVLIYSMRPIRAGEELFIDYALIVEDTDPDEARRDHPCACGAPSCRGTIVEL